MKNLPKDLRKVLLSSDNSRQNKIWLITGWQTKYFIEWKWQGDPYNSRMLFKFSPDDDYLIAKSFDEDIFIKYSFGEKKKKDTLKK